MKLSRVGIRNYRSITYAPDIPIGDYTVLVGANNEGKSNILRAVVVGLSVLAGGIVYQPRRSRIIRYTYEGAPRLDYNWDRDFPIQLQDASPEGRSLITFEFALETSEFEDFRNKVGVNLSSTLKLRLSFGKTDVLFEIMIQGPGKKPLNAKRKEVAAFIQEKLLVQYISAIRPAEYAQDIVETVVDTELSTLEKDPKYVQLNEELNKLREPVIESLCKKLHRSVLTFMPDVKSLTIRPVGGFRRAISSRCKVYVDDGVSTELQLKGDGIISLASISMVRHISQETPGNRNLIFAIEEPESHLHPLAVSRLRGILHEIANSHQVIITTHSPILVERGSVGKNILVNSQQARAAKDVAEIRNSLGIAVSDNLSSASLVLLVEGGSDKIILSALLPLASTNLKTAMQNGILVIDDLGGASKLSYKVSLYKNLLSGTFAYLDNDAEAREAVERAIESGHLADKEYSFVNCVGMSESEIEDMFLPQTYENGIKSEFGIALNRRTLKENKKWSNKVRKIFLDNAKAWNDRIEKKIKDLVASSIAGKGLTTFNPIYKASFDALVRQLEEIVNGL